MLAPPDRKCCLNSVHQVAESSLSFIHPDLTCMAGQCISGMCRVGTLSDSDQVRAISCVEEILVKLEEGEERMSDDDVADMLVSLLFAGHDTSAHTLTRLLAELPRHPGVWDRLKREQARVRNQRKLPKLCQGVSFHVMQLLESLLTLTADRVSDNALHSDEAAKLGPVAHALRTPFCSLNSPLLGFSLLIGHNAGCDLVML